MIGIIKNEWMRVEFCFSQKNIVTQRIEFVHFLSHSICLLNIMNINIKTNILCFLIKKNIKLLFYFWGAFREILFFHEEY
jgi:hypothetical protein